MVSILTLTKRAERGSENRSFRVVFFIAICALFSLLISCAQTKDPAQESSTATGPRTADQARVTQIDDAKIKELLKPAGRPLLVNFWATWCGPCREEFPDLVEIDKEYKGKIDFFTVSLDFAEELETGVPAFLREMKAGMPTYLLTSSDENAMIASISKEWSGALPFTVLYNEKGDIIFQRQGKVDHDTLTSEIEKALIGQK